MSQVVCLNLSLFHSGTYLKVGNAKPIGFQKFPIWLKKYFEGNINLFLQRLFGKSILILIIN
jgi:hypothetical protein